ncbi:MAG TPA: 30S ribosome-binding factor RbfA [Thermoanaerobaculia bacterium]|nr:30S ribosome-binding factor RbfA [Thermoanaerobaculia bacterium]
MSRRTGRVGDQIRAELSDLLLRHVQDPRVRLASVTDVEVSPDLRRAVVKVSVLGEEAQRLETVEALRHARGYLRTELAHRMRTRVTPELIFELDRGAEYSQRISEILESLDDGRDESS